MFIPRDFCVTCRRPTTRDVIGRHPARWQLLDPKATSSLENAASHGTAVTDLNTLGPSLQFTLSMVLSGVVRFGIPVVWQRLVCSMDTPRENSVAFTPSMYETGCANIIFRYAVDSLHGPDI